MAVFGMNGIAFVALDLLLVFAVYGMKRISMNEGEVAAVGRMAARKAIAAKGGNPDDAKRAAVEYRTALLRQIKSEQATRYKDMGKEFEKAYVSKTFLR